MKLRHQDRCWVVGSSIAAVLSLWMVYALVFGDLYKRVKVTPEVTMYKSLFAFTAPDGDMPEYISVVGEGTDCTTITVRGAKEYGSHTAIIMLTDEQRAKLKAAL